MASLTAFKATIAPFKSTTTSIKSHRRATHAVKCSATSDRRSLLAGIAGAVVTLPLVNTPFADAKLIDKVIPGKNLSTFQRADLIAEFTKRYETELKKVLSISDAPAALRLLLHDAATYDAVTKTGGVNGSIVLSEELSRPENKDLKDLVARLSKARDAGYAAGPEKQKQLSWADTIVLAVKVTQEMGWREDKLAKNPKNGEFLVASFSNPITVNLGRLDAATPDAPNRFPAPGSSPSDVQKFMNTLGVKDPASLEGPFARKPLFWERITFVLWTAAQPDPAASEAEFAAANPIYAEYKEKYDRSRKTSFRQDYEIDFNEYFNKLANLASIDKSAYLYDVTIKVPERL